MRVLSEDKKILTTRSEGNLIVFTDYEWVNTHYLFPNVYLDVKCPSLPGFSFEIYSGGVKNFASFEFFYKAYQYAVDNGLTPVLAGEFNIYTKQGELVQTIIITETKTRNERFYIRFSNSFDDRFDETIEVENIAYTPEFSTRRACGYSQPKLTDIYTASIPYNDSDRLGYIIDMLHSSNQTFNNENCIVTAISDISLQSPSGVVQVQIKLPPNTNPKRKLKL